MTDSPATPHSQEHGSHVLSVILPVYNSRSEWLAKAISSICDQTLDAALFELIIVDDCSTDPAIVKYLDNIQQMGEIRGIKTRVIRHEKNAWLAQARMTGVAAASAEYVAFIDDDDYYEDDYLKKALLLLSSSPDIAWVYPTMVKFGQFIERKPAVRFSPFSFFFLNRSPYASVFRKKDWLAVGQREVFALPEVRFFEDWDTYIRLMARGGIGTPLNDSAVRYRKFAGGLAARNTREYIVSVYTTWRQNLSAIPLLPLNAWRLRRSRRLGYGKPRIFSIQRLIDKAMTALVSGVFKLPTPVGLVDKKLVFYSLFSPEKFKKNIMDGQNNLSMAESRMGFLGRYHAKFNDTFPQRPMSKSTALFAHTWWCMGGAEEVFYDWAKIARDSGVTRIIDVTDLRAPDSDFLKEKFDEICDEQYALYKYGETPLQQLRMMWNIICYEKPRLIYISGSSPAYALLPHVKKHFPDTRVVDILHNEFNNHTDWFTVSNDYQNDIDLRLVTTEYWRDLLVVKYNEEFDKIRIVNNPLDTEDRFHPQNFDRAEIREQLGLTEDQRAISFMARLHHQKHPEVFIELAKNMLEDDRFVFVVVGSGDGSEGLVAEIKSTKNMIYLGDTTRPEYFMAAMDLLVCPSRFEGYPLITLIAGALNVPILVSDVTGHREQVNNGKFGLLYEPTGEEKSDARTLSDILEDRYEELVALGSNGRAFVESRHSLEAVQPVYQQIIQEQLGTDVTLSDTE